MNRTERLAHKWRIVESVKASELAKKLGLKDASFGNWKNAQGEITHKTVDGKLVPVKDAEAATPDIEVKLKDVTSELYTSGKGIHYEAMHKGHSLGSIAKEQSEWSVTTEHGDDLGKFKSKKAATTAIVDDYKSKSTQNSEGAKPLSDKFLPRTRNDAEPLVGRIKEGLGLSNIDDISFLDEDAMDIEEFEELGDLIVELGELEGEVEDSDGFVATYNVDGIKVVLTNDSGYSTINVNKKDIDKLENALN